MKPFPSSRLYGNTVRLKIRMISCLLIPAALWLLAAMMALPLPVSAAAAVHVADASISGDSVIVSTQGLTETDDGIYHLFAQLPYENGRRGLEVASAPASETAVFTFPLNQGTADSNLYKRFAVFVKKGGKWTVASDARYITNPEALAQHTFARHDLGKKGILPAAELLSTSGLAELGIRQITYNVPIGNVFAGTGITYEYNGKTYTFSRAIVGQYDHLVPLMNGQNIQVTLVFLNNLTDDTSLLHPLSRDYRGADYYAFNTAERSGVERLAAVASFFATRYSGGQYGTVDNWVVGNEANARLEWHYMTASAGIDRQVQEYEKSVRICYNAVKSVNANARVYISLDREWAGTDFPGRHYPGRTFLQKFNDYAVSEGNYGWDLAVHPYNVQIYDPKVWAYSPKAVHSQNSAFITMRNIEIVTDLMCTKAYLNPAGEVRSVFISEVGYSSLQGESLQAASMVYGYLQCEANQYIDGYIYFRQLDDPTEVQLSLASGLVNLNGSHKLSYSWYQNVDSPKVQAEAAAVMGVSDIHTLLTSR